MYSGSFLEAKASPPSFAGSSFSGANTLESPSDPHSGQERALRARLSLVMSAGRGRARPGLEYRLADTTMTAQASVLPSGVFSTRGSSRLLVLANQSGQNIGTKPPNFTLVT